MRELLRLSQPAFTLKPAPFCCPTVFTDWDSSSIRYLSLYIDDAFFLSLSHILRVYGWDSGTDGLDCAAKQKRRGSRTDSMFRRYAIVNEEQKREALAKTQQYLGNSSERKVVSIGQK